MQIQTRPIDSLTPYARNSRTHTAVQIAQIAASIREFGMAGAIIIRGNTIAKGHGTLAAIALIYQSGELVYPVPGKAAGAEPFPRGEAPTIDATGWTDNQFRAYVIADNQLALTAGWDNAILAGELRDLLDASYDVGLTGFDLPTIDELVASLGATPEGNTDPDDAPPVEAVAISKLGDVWLLGNHRIMCGDSTDAAQVKTLLGGGVPHLMVTDPPYGVEYDADWRNKALRADGTPIGGHAVGKVLNDDRADWREAWALFPGEVAYVWHAGSFSHTVADSLIACGFKLYSLIVWGKNQMVIGRGHYHPKQEPCWYAVKKGGTGHWQGDRTQTTLWSIDKPRKSETGHSTQKPIECMKRPIENNSVAGDGIYEPFSGSGTTIIAAEQTARRCYAMELSPNYVDVAVRRWQQFTGKTATHAVTGAAFPS